MIQLSSTSGSSVTAPRAEASESHSHVPEPEPARRLCRDAGRSGTACQRASPDTVRITVTQGGGTPGSFLDTFDRDDSDSLGGPSQTDPQWSEAAGNLVIASADQEWAQGRQYRHAAALTGATQSASGDFISSDNNASPRLGVLLRVQDAPEPLPPLPDLRRVRASCASRSSSTAPRRCSSPSQVPLAPVGHAIPSRQRVSRARPLTLTMGTVQITVDGHDVPEREHRRCS